MDKLPTEVIEKVLSNSALTYKDIINASVTCKHLHIVVYNSNYIWKSVFTREWPKYSKYVQTGIWFNEYKYVFNILQQAKCILLSMPAQFYSIPDTSNCDFQVWSELVREGPYSYNIVMDYLIKLVQSKQVIEGYNTIPLSTPGNQTLKYYAMKAAQHLKHQYLRQVYAEFMNLSEDERILEKVATFVAQWCQPMLPLEYKDIQDELNVITKQIYSELQAKNPDHPLFTVSLMTQLKWQDQNLTKSQFSITHCREILDTINDVLFLKKGFIQNINDFYNPNNSYINLVLEHKMGLPITLSIIYESIARRLGVLCEPISLPNRFVLRFRPNVILDGDDLFIDTTEFSRLVYIYREMNRAPDFPNMLFSIESHPTNSPASSTSVMLRMAGNLEIAMREASSYSPSNLSSLHAVLELTVLIAPSDLNALLNLARMCMSLNMDVRYIEDIIMNTEYHDSQSADNLLRMLRNYEGNRCRAEALKQSLPKTRPQGLQFAVGLVIRHKKYNYRGVITDWTPECSASPEWQKTMNINGLSRKGKQPFYYVIVEDGTNRYVAEENIEISNDAGNLLDMNEIGRHFSHFYKNQFIPNCEKHLEYPEDAEIRKTYEESI